MNKKTLNTNNVEIPPVVRNKINLAILQLKSEEENNMKHFSINKTMKLTIAAAACAVICLCSIFAANSIHFGPNGPTADITGSSDSSILRNPFVIKVMAAELEPDIALPISIVGAPDAFYLGGFEFDNNYSVDYCINLPISCQGENIESITYSINKGAFQVIEPETNSFVTNGIETDCSFQTKISGNTYDTSQINGSSDQNLIINVPESENQSIVVYDSDNTAYDSTEVDPSYYKAFTVNYNKQDCDELLINICDNISATEELFNLIYGDEHSNTAAALNTLLKDVEITVTANYIDGTTESKTIGLEAQVVENAPENSEAVQIFVKEI